MSLSPGDKLGPYEILAPIGAGGMGDVYKARDTRLDRIVAVKISMTEFSERFDREARAIAALNHPHICQIYDVGPNYLVMEFVDGGPLAAPDSPRKLLDFAVQIAEGMAAAHAVPLVHRDLKPDNILVTGAQSVHPGRVKILDFGLAKMTVEVSGNQNATRTIGITGAGTTVGTIAYMSPEQARGLPNLTPQSDQFSFGLILYELASGKRAFVRPSAAETMTAIIREDAEPLPASVPMPLRWVIERLLAKEPTERYDSTKDLYRELKQIRERYSETTSAHQVSPVDTAPPATRRGRRWATTAALVGLAVAAAFGAARFLWPMPQPLLWTGTMMGGSEVALTPRLSPDGHLLAFEAMVDGQTQIAVMKPESGNWSILTRDRDHGPTSDLSWSPDGTLIYYDRYSGNDAAIYSVPVLGGDERMVLEKAFWPEALPDGSLLIVKLNAERKFELHRFWPATGQLQALGFRTGDYITARVRPLPDGKSAVAWGEPLGQSATSPSFYVIDLSSRAARRLDPHGVDAEEGANGLTVSPDGKSIITVVHSGALARIFRFPISGAAPPTQLLTLSSQVWSLDAGPDGGIYANIADRPVEVVRFAADGTRLENLANFPQVPDLTTMALLPDGRAVIPVLRASSQLRLMVVQKGKEPAPLVNTTQETAAPVTSCGSGQVAFMIGPQPHETIALAEPASGRLIRTIAPGKGPVDSIACSPDGKTVYFTARGVVWSIPSGASTGTEARKIRAGDIVVAEPSGRQLLVQAQESSYVHRFIVPLDGAPEREIPVDATIAILSFGLSPDALKADGRLLTSLLARDCWFNPPGILDNVTGRVTRLPFDRQSDYQSLGWTPDGQVMALKTGLRSTIWKFQPASH